MRGKVLSIISHYGSKNQLKKFTEECYELVEAILDYENGVGTRRHIEEEIADCYVIIEQFRLYYGISTVEIQKVMKYKINRTIDRIKDND